MAIQPTAEQHRTPSRSWRFGMRSLLFLLLLVSCMLALWRWNVEKRQEQMVKSIGQQGSILQNGRNGTEESVNQLRIRQMVRHRKFRSSGLYHRILATHDGFGRFQLQCTQVAEREHAGGKEICLVFADRRRPRCELLIAFAPNNRDFSWIEINAENGASWPSRLAITAGNEVRAVVTRHKAGQFYQQMYRLRARGIDLVEENALVDQAAEAELLRAWGIDRLPRGSSSSGLEGPESDLR